MPTFDAQIEQVQEQELGLKTPAAVVAKKTALKDIHWKIMEINRGLLARFAEAKAGTILELPGGSHHLVKQTAMLGAIAKEIFGSADRAEELLQLNESTVPLPVRLPPGTLLKVPQRTWPALAAFAVLVVCLLLVGLGLLLRGDPTEGAAKAKPDRGNLRPDRDPTAQKPPAKPDETRR